jgi:hypothetical protein
LTGEVMRTSPAAFALDRITDLCTICVREEHERQFRCASPYVHPVAG